MNSQERKELSRYVNNRLYCDICRRLMWPTMDVGCGYYRFTCKEGHQTGNTWPHGWADDKPGDVAAWKRYIAEGAALVALGIIPRAWDSIDGAPVRNWLGLWKFIKRDRNRPGS